MSRNERIVWSGVASVGAIGGGILLMNAQLDCDSNSEASNACTFGDHSADLAATVGGGMLVLGGVALLVATGYLLTQ